MKKFLKVFLVLLLIGVLGFEIYMYFFKQNVEDTSVVEKKKTTKLETKYLVDIYTGYKVNGVSFKVVKDSNKLYYHTIYGLKDKELEQKINDKIRNKVAELQKNIDSNHNLSSSIVSSFENTLSMVFCSSERDKYSLDEYSCSSYSSIDSLNIDLTTGNDVTIYDVVNSKDALREQLNIIGYESLMKDIGIICGGGPCTNPDPDYSTVEDDLLSLITKYNKDDFIFSYAPDYLYIKFKGVNITKPEECTYGKSKNCKKYKMKYSDTDIYLNQHGHVSEYQLGIPFVKLLDNLTIYDKFKTKDSIFEKDGKKVNIKFSTPDDYSSPQMIETDNSLIDYNIFYYRNDDEVDASESIRNGLIKEMKALETKNFNIYNVFGDITYITSHGKDYNYVYFDVRHYDMPKSVYEKNRKKIYAEKYNKISYSGGASYAAYTEGEKSEYGYEFLKDYMNRKAFFYYIYDDNGKEVPTEKFVSFDYLKRVIPSSWLSLGNYSSMDAMINDCLILLRGDYKYPNKLVIEDDGLDITLKYKNKKLKLTKNYEDYEKILEKLYR